MARRLLTVLAATAVALPMMGAPAQAADRPRLVAQNLVLPWGISFLPDGSAIVTERESGRIYQLNAAGAKILRYTVTESDGAAAGEGGLLGVAVSPNYSTDKRIYVYYSTQSDNRVARITLGSSARPVPLLTGIPRGTTHNGGQLRFGADGTLYASTGDAGDTSRSQDTASLGGKILRMTTTGQPAPGNPFSGSVVWSLGHRNVQGLVFDRERRLFASEFGQNTYDEVNLIVKGGNYGWPVVEGKAGRAGYRDPIWQESPSVASPSGITNKYGQLYVAALRGQRIWKLQLDYGTTVKRATSLYQGDFGRIRAVVQNPKDLSTWVLTSNRDGRSATVQGDDRVIRITNL